MMAQQVATEAREAKRKVENIGEKVADHANAAGADLAEEFAALRQQLEKLSIAMTDQAKATVGAAAEQAGGAARRVARKAEAGYEHAVDQAAGAYAEAERFTAEKPATALGLAAGVGLLVGLMLARR